MTEPTEAEIWQMWMPMVRRMGVADPVEFARAVLAKWGTPQPIQPHADAEPLTEKQREAIWQECRYDNGEGWEVDCWEVIDAVERMHRIKGGQHGAE